MRFFNMLPDRQTQRNATRHNALVGVRKKKEEKKMEKERAIYHKASYLHYQDDHAYGSQHMLVFIQPFLHFLKAALK